MRPGLTRAHPYDPNAYLNVYEEGWEKRLGQKPAKAAAQAKRKRSH